LDAPSAPTPPDPVATAAAQTQSNKETAVANANLNRYNQYGPQGSVEWQVVGTNADGTPRYTQTTAYAPGEQQVYNTNLATRQNVGQIGLNASNRIGDLLNTNFNPNEEVAAQLNDLGRKRLDPRFQQEQATLEQQLANKGITMGSEAYGRAMDRFGQTKNDAYNQLALTGQQQAWNQAVANRSQPINEVTALMSGSQVSTPWLGQQQNTNMANTDVAGITQNAFQNQMGIYNAEMGRQNAMMGGAAGIIGQGMRFVPWSDRRLKKDIVPLGIHDSGLMAYEWTYTFGPGRYRGFIADEVARLYPHAVIRMPNGFDAVDYARIG
jgi:hypothetical protein